MTNVTGLLVALLSAIANGSFTVLSKLDVVKSTGVDIAIFNLYMCLGAGVSSLFSLLFGITFAFSWLGIVSGVFLTVSCANAFIAVHILGVGVASGVWCGTAVIVSFIFGEFFDTPVSNLPLAIAGLALLIVSIVGIGYVGAKSDESSNVDGRLDAPLLEDDAPPGKSSFSMGIASAIIAGLLGGLIISPENFASSQTQNLSYLPSFGIGVLIISPIYTTIVYLWERKFPEFHITVVGPLGFLAGVVWNTANICSIIAISMVGYSIAYPIMQCGLFVAGIWGIFLFGEISGPIQRFYWLSGGVLLFGAILLGLSS